MKCPSVAGVSSLASGSATAAELKAGADRVLDTPIKGRTRRRARGVGPPLGLNRGVGPIEVR